jgi:hypothetical protein
MSEDREPTWIVAFCPLCRPVALDVAKFSGRQNVPSPVSLKKAFTCWKSSKVFGFGAVDMRKAAAFHWYMLVYWMNNLDNIFTGPRGVLGHHGDKTSA